MKTRAILAVMLLAFTPLVLQAQEAAKVYKACSASVILYTYEDGEGYIYFGTGFVIHPNGYILTSLHNLSKDIKGIVRFRDGREFVPVIVLEDKTLDLAVLKINATGLPQLPLATSPPEPGVDCYIIGNPYGETYGWSITRGIVSGVNRDLNMKDGRVKKGLLQTDAAVNGGNSGGPLLNSRGEVMGLICALKSTANGMSFAVSGRDIQAFLTKLPKQ